MNAVGEEEVRHVIVCSANGRTTGIAAYRAYSVRRINCSMKDIAQLANVNSSITLRTRRRLRVNNAWKPGSLHGSEIAEIEPTPVYTIDRRSRPLTHCTAKYRDDRKWLFTPTFLPISVYNRLHPSNSCFQFCSLFPLPHVPIPSFLKSTTAINFHGKNGYSHSYADSFILPSKLMRLAPRCR